MTYAELRKEKSKLRRLVRRHRGNLTAAGAELGVTRQALAARLSRHFADLLEYANRLRVRHVVAGTRGPLEPAARASERERLLGALKRGGHRAAARALKIGVRTVTRRVREFGIVPAEYQK